MKVIIICKLATLKGEAFGPFNWFQILPSFSFNKFVEELLGPFEQVCNFVKSAEKVEILFSESKIKFLLDEIFAGHE